MNLKHDLARMVSDIVYVKPVAVAELPEDMRAQAGDRDQIFAVCDADGQQLALVADRSTAFFIARQNDRTPVTVH